MGVYSQRMKDEFKEVISDGEIPFYTHTGRTLDMSTIDPETDGELGCVPTAKTSFGVLDKDYKVVLSPDVSQTFRKIMLKVANINYTGSKQEIGFLLIGEEKPDKTIEINNLTIYDFGYRSVGFNAAQEDLVIKLADRMAETGREEGKKPFLIFGHTHPAQREYPNFVSNSWSLGDLWASFVESKVLGDKVQFADLLITPSLDTNLMFYESGKEVGKDFKGFYRFAEGVYETNMDGKIGRINHAYTDPKSEPECLDPRQFDPDILN